MKKVKLHVGRFTNRLISIKEKIYNRMLTIFLICNKMYDENDYHN